MLFPSLQPRSRTRHHRWGLAVALTLGLAAPVASAAPGVRHERRAIDRETDPGALQERVLRAHAEVERALGEAGPSASSVARLLPFGEADVESLCAAHVVDNGDLGRLQQLARRLPPEDPLRADVLFRLASLHVARRIYFDEASRRVDEELRAARGGATR